MKKLIKKHQARIIQFVTLLIAAVLVTFIPEGSFFEKALTGLVWAYIIIAVIAFITSVALFFRTREFEFSFKFCIKKKDNSNL